MIGYCTRSLLKTCFELLNLNISSKLKTLNHRNLIEILVDNRAVCTKLNILCKINKLVINLNVV